ncbi:MAG: hypothetical protein ACYTHK_05100 [Planctomycetota bacterium]|jgi:hypothetical protein
MGTRQAVKIFVDRAEAFLEKYPDSGSNGIVRLWLGDLLKRDDPRRALAYYRASDWPDAERRARDLALLFEPAPRLRIVRWIGDPTPPTKPNGEVTYVFFFSIAHPSTKRLHARVEKLLTTFRAQGLRAVGVAAVVDNHAEQQPGDIEAWFRQRPPTFPVAIDQQRKDDASVSLRLYRGNKLPWGAILDRYGRVTWLGALELGGNAKLEREAKIRALLRDPSYETLERLGSNGDEAAIKQLASIKTPRSVTALYGIRESKPPQKLAKLVDDSLRAMLPRGFGPGDAKRWAEVSDGYRYSFEDDRLIRLPPAERTPVVDR